MLKVGLAQKDITPPLGSPLAGNFRKDYGCKGIYHRLYAHALVIDDGSNKVGIVMADLIVDGLPDVFYAQEALILKEKENQPVKTELQVIIIGDLALVGLPGEVFVEFGMEIKKRSPYKWTFIIGLANDYIGYVPTINAFDEGGYEPTPARHSQLAENAGELLVESACEKLFYLKNEFL